MFVFVVMYAILWILWYVTAQIEIQQKKPQRRRKCEFFFKRNLKQFFRYSGLGWKMRVPAEAPSNVVKCNCIAIFAFAVANGTRNIKNVQFVLLWDWCSSLSVFILLLRSSLLVLSVCVCLCLFFSPFLPLPLPLSLMSGTIAEKSVLGYTEYVKLVKWNIWIIALIQL